MIVEADGRRVGLFVDELLSQQQVVIKSLETNSGRSRRWPERPCSATAGLR